jgi:hypothetical protein
LRFSAAALQEATVVPQSDDGTNVYSALFIVLSRVSLGVGTQSVKDRIPHRKQILALLALTPLVAGCGSMFNSDLLSKDAEWFSRPGRLFIKNVSIETPPLTPDQPVAAEDFVSADGACPGMAPAGASAEANALTDGAAGAPPVQSGTVALGHTECDVVRGIGAPDTVNISNGPRGGRVAVINWSRGPRAGIYTFTGGRLTSVERGPEPVAQPKAAKPKAKKKSAAT